VTKIGELGTTQAATSNRCTLRNFFATRRNNPEDTILHSHRREKHKSYSRISIWIDQRTGAVLFGWSGKQTQSYLDGAANSLGDNLMEQKTAVILFEWISK
jgi:hypothetical protein